MLYKVLWELLVCVFARKCIRAICCEKTSEHALFTFAMFKHTIERFCRVKNHEVITWQMDLQAYNRWVLVTNGELKKAPSSLHCCNVANVFEFQYLILMALLNLDCGSVRAFMYVFSDVFRSSQRHKTFDIYVGIEPACERLVGTAIYEARQCTSEARKGYKAQSTGCQQRIHQHCMSGCRGVTRTWGTHQWSSTLLAGKV